MIALEDALQKAERGESSVPFNHLKHRIRCYAHIINICSSHIISSMTSVSKGYVSELGVSIESDDMICNVSGDEESDDDEVDAKCEVKPIKLADRYNARGSPELKAWFAGIKRDPLKRARRIIRYLRSSDQRRQGFRQFLIDGNERGWFKEKEDEDDPDEEGIAVRVPEVQLLRDVKTRWDSVYTMLERLRSLRLVSSPQQLDVVKSGD